MRWESTDEKNVQENKSHFTEAQDQKIYIKTDPKIFKEQNKIKEEENIVQPHERNNPKKKKFLKGNH